MGSTLHKPTRCLPTTVTAAQTGLFGAMVDKSHVDGSGWHNLPSKISATKDLGRDARPPIQSSPHVPRRQAASDTSKVKKRSSPRNTKAWTLEDERALLQGRLERIPYKQIGARIGKTDLACRLHFHQMVMAKKTPETAPGRSIVFLSSEHPPEVHRLAPTHPTLATSTALSTICGIDATTMDDSTYHDSSRYRQPMHQRSYSSPHLDPNLFSGWQPVASPYPDYPSNAQSPGTVDLSRLNNIYKQHAGDFWSTIAAKYSGGESLTPLQLEQAFLQGQSVDEPSPEIPRIVLSSSEPPSVAMASPEDPTNTTRARAPSNIRSSSTSSIAGKCSVESLLNHGRI